VLLWIVKRKVLRRNPVLSTAPPLLARKGVDPSGARIRRKPDRSSTRVRLAQRDGDAGETPRARQMHQSPASDESRAL
jgi:hypothetical protein